MLPLHCPYALPQGRVGFGSGSPRIHVPSLFGDAASGGASTTCAYLQPHLHNT
jgi:hypothetical protein